MKHTVFTSCSCAMPHGSLWSARRAFLLTAAAASASPVLAQVDVGDASSMRKLVPAETLESAATQQYDEMLAQAKAKRALAGPDNPQLVRLHGIARQLIPFTYPWNERAKGWKWEVNLIGSKQINAFCMPGGKIAFFTGILDQLKLTDAEVAMVMGHEMAHALREHSRARLAKTQATNIGISLGAALLGLGDVGRAAAGLGSQLLTLKFSRSDETDADLVGLELAARAGYDPQASITLWEKMGKATGQQGMQFLSTHPSGPNRIKELRENVARVQGLYDAARRGQK
ncbi:M48 family metallopeptidase [Diaphorobacter caeni]|uniref:M48 family metallopeptidase n=1 Tax=Diaphorobacter caeni TaxID=2784387 RepID=UPI00188E9A42|nr:M48 family metallopeptidase [Diaphorobacter caeni]MBF5005460.1 M48 family metallopeptidase [Diaphorobacter caeni]